VNRWRTAAASNPILRNRGMPVLSRGWRNGLAERYFKAALDQLGK
jgi:hypothetical protein